MTPLSSQLTNSRIESPDQIKIDPLTRLPGMFDFDYILKHLHGGDIINLSFVSKSWNFVVHNSREYMNKTKVRIDYSKTSSRRPKQSELKLIKKNPKRFQNFDFSCQHNQIISQECLNIINIFRETIVELILQEMVEVDTEFIGDIWLPNLKVLKLKSTNEKPCYQLFNSCRNLEVVHFDCIYDESILDCLYKNPNIYDIKFSNDVFESIFHNDPLDDFPFKISSFTSLAWKTDQMTEFSFIQFLSKQTFSLTRLKLFYASHKMIEFIYNELDIINVVDIKYFETCRSIDETFDPIPKNNEITEINLHHNVLLVGIRAMIKAAPKLKVLRVKFINKTIVEFVTVLCKNLRLLIYCYDMDKSEELYKVLIRNTRTEVNRKIILKCTNFQ